jgi:hypothetical protein
VGANAKVCPVAEGIGIHVMAALGVIHMVNKFLSHQQSDYVEKLEQRKKRN